MGPGRRMDVPDATVPNIVQALVHDICLGVLYTVVVNGPLQPESAGHRAGQRPACPSGGTKGPLLGRRWLVGGQGAQGAKSADACQVHLVGLNTAVRKSCIILALVVDVDRSQNTGEKSLYKISIQIDSSYNQHLQVFPQKKTHFLA